MWTGHIYIYIYIYMYHSVTLLVVVQLCIPSCWHLYSTLLILHREVCTMKDAKKGSRTSKLWLNFTKFMTIVRSFIRAERTGNWGLHLEATYNMLQFLAASGHNNCTRSCRLYLQDCQISLCQSLQQQFNKAVPYSGVELGLTWLLKNVLWDLEKQVGDLSMWLIKTQPVWSGCFQHII